MRRYLPTAVLLLVVLAGTFAITWRSLDASSGGALGLIPVLVLAVVGAILVAAGSFRAKIRVEAPETVRGPAVEVFERAADLRNMPSYSPQILSVDLDGPLRVGAVFHVRVRTPRNAVRRTDFEVTAYDPPREIVMQPWFRGRPSRHRRTGLTVREENDHAVIVGWTEVVHSRFLARWIRPVLQRAESESIGALKAWLDRPTPVPDQPRSATP